jgi:N-acetylmuramic acid 6-phosphate (MurNAc-6-P) etherase
VILPWAGAKDLQEITQGADHVILFGITCGLSAPYVAGQIDYSMHQVCNTAVLESDHSNIVSGQPNYTTVLVGFNPVQLARSAPIEKWNKTCKDVSVACLRRV